MTTTGMTVLWVGILVFWFVVFTVVRKHRERHEPGPGADETERFNAT